MNKKNVVDEYPRHRPLLPSEADNYVNEMMISVFKEPVWKGRLFPSKIRKPYDFKKLFLIEEPVSCKMIHFFIQNDFSMAVRARGSSRYGSAVSFHSGKEIRFALPAEYEKEYNSMVEYMDKISGHKERVRHIKPRNIFFQNITVGGNDPKVMVVEYGIRIFDLIKNEEKKLKLEDKWPCYLSIIKKDDTTSSFEIKSLEDKVSNSVIEISKKPCFNLDMYCEKMLDRTREEWFNIVDFVKNPTGFKTLQNTRHW